MANRTNLNVLVLNPCDNWDNWGDKIPLVRRENNTTTLYLDDRNIIFNNNYESENAKTRGIWNHFLEINQILCDENANLTPLSNKGIEKILYSNYGLLRNPMCSTFDSYYELRDMNLNLTKLLLARLEVDPQMSDDLLDLCIRYFKPGNHTKECFQEFRNSCAVYQNMGCTPLEAAKKVCKLV